MKKSKVEAKPEKSFDAFFESKNLDKNDSLGFVKNTELLTLGEEDLKDKSNSFIYFLKQIFLFFPGTFLLYLVGFVGAVILMDILVFQRPLETLPPSAAFQIILLTAIGFLGIFMTWFGLGDIKNKKHLSIPASILITGAAIAVIFKAIEDLFGFSKLLEQFNHYYFYLLPLILIIPVLVKSWIDKESDI